MIQENYEHEGKQDNHQTGENIVKGANNEDQLDKFKEAAPEGGRDAYPEKQQGTPPDAYKYEREEESDDTTQSAGD